MCDEKPSEQEKNLHSTTLSIDCIHLTEKQEKKIQKKN